jgi:hypothetical protein
MPYIYRTTFDIDREHVDQLQIGQSIELSIAYLKAFLANEPGFINARAMYSLAEEKTTHVSFESTWEDWETLEAHRQTSPYSEAKMLHRFEFKVEPQNIADHVYEEIA